MLPSLEEVLSFKHPAVVRRFQREHPERHDEAEQLFSDLMRFFWASKKHDHDQQQKPKEDDLNFVFIMDEEMRYIDQMWHVFLLYTKDYSDFCDKYFGEFLHHLPDIVPELRAGDFDAEMNLTKFLGFIYDHLGEEVVRRWFPLSCQ